MKSVWTLAHLLRWQMTVARAMSIRIQIQLMEACTWQRQLAPRPLKYAKGNRTQSLTDIRQDIGTGQ